MWINGDRTPSPTLVDLRAATDRAPCRYSFDVALTSDHDVINHINRGLMPMIHSPKVGANNRYQKTDTGFWRVWHAIWYRIFLVYQFLVTCCIFAPVYSTDFLVRVASADFWSVCHGHKGKIFQVEWCLLGGLRFLHGNVCLLAMQFFFLQPCCQSLSNDIVNLKRLSCLERHFIDLWFV